MKARICESFSSLVAVCLLISPPTARAQSQTTGSIAGVVKDPAGAAVPRAEARAKNEVTGEVKSA